MKTITLKTSHIVILVILLCVVIGIWMAVSQSSKPDYYALEVTDGRVLVGNLKGNTLCRYLQLSVAVDPKTKQKSISTSPGGQVYNGDGCLEIIAPVQWKEKISTGSQMYNQLSTVR